MLRGLQGLAFAALAAAVIALASFEPGWAAARTRPNIVVILADDLGWARVGYNNPQMSTPNIDRLARDGVRLDNYYAMLNCSPTRAGLLTGRYPVRFGLQSAVVRPWDLDVGLPASEVTIADRLGAAGYRHRAIYGKWHLGHGSAEFHPLSHGFTEFFGHYNGFIDYYTHVRNREVDLHEGFAPASRDLDGRYLTDLIEQRAVGFIRARAADREPFLLYLPFLNPHAPIQDPPSVAADYSQVTNPQVRTHMAMVSALDAAIGRILAELEKNGMDRNTILVFASDNGGDPLHGSDNGPLRGGKGTAWEGGIRVPAIVRWPAGGLAGGRVVTGRVAFVDLAPTLLKAAGATPGRNPMDGIDVMPLLKGGVVQDRPIFTMTGAERTEDGRGGESDRIAHDVTAVNAGGWKLTWRRWPRDDGQSGWGREEFTLYHIAEDPLETAEVSAAHPEIVQRLKGEIARFRAMAPKDGRRAASPSIEPPAGFRPPKDWAVEAPN